MEDRSSSTSSFQRRVCSRTIRADNFFGRSVIAPCLRDAAFLPMEKPTGGPNFSCFIRLAEVRRLTIFYNYGSATGAQRDRSGASIR